MGGGGGGSSVRPSGPRPGQNGDDFDCNNVSINTSLVSPDPDIIANLDEGDTLEIAIGEDGALVAFYEGEVAGSITHYSYTDIISCLEEGHQYIATVLRIRGGNCELNITNL